MRRRSRVAAWAPLLAAFACTEAHADWLDAGSLPIGRAQAAVAVDQSGAIHLIGGYNTSSTPVATHDVFFVDGGWGSAAPLPFGNRGGAAATGPDGVIYFVGGYQPAGPSNAAYAFGTDGGWSQLDAAVADAASTTEGPGWETAAEFGANGKLYVFGGEGVELSDSGASLGFANSRTVIFDPVAMTWSFGASMPARREQHRAIRGSDGNIYVIGGQDETHSTATNTVFVYHPSSNSWTMGPPLAVPPDADAGDAGDAGDGGLVPVPVNSFGVAATPDRSILIVVGGSTRYGNGVGPYFSDVYLFDVGMQKWTKYPTPLPAGRRELMAAFHTCSLHALGGTGGGLPATEHDVAQLISVTTEVCNGKDDDCDGVVDNGVSCSGAAGTRCVTDTTTHCGCNVPGDCAATQTCNTTTHLCEGPGGDAGGDDGGGGMDSGSSSGGDDASLGGGSDGGGDGGDNGGGSSSGCGCSLVGGDSSGGLAALGGLGVVVAAALRARRRRRR